MRAKRSLGPSTQFGVGKGREKGGYAIEGALVLWAGRLNCRQSGLQQTYFFPVKMATRSRWLVSNGACEGASRGQGGVQTAGKQSSSGRHFVLCWASGGCQPFAAFLAAFVDLSLGFD
ncbi:hypothetical protein ACLOJK_020358 [Asimina triloba]